MHNWLRSEWDKLDVIIRKIVKKALGLPVRTHTENLLKLGVHNSAAEIAEAQERSEPAILSTTTTGRHILAELGLNPVQLETNRKRISKNVQENVTVAPIPRNVHPVHNEGRCRVRATAVLKQLGMGSVQVQASSTLQHIETAISSLWWLSTRLARLRTAPQYAQQTPGGRTSGHCTRSARWSVWRGVQRLKGRQSEPFKRAAYQYKRPGS